MSINSKVNKWSYWMHFCVSSDTSSRVETWNPTAQRQRVCGSQWTGVGHRVQCVCGGRESEGQVAASNHVLQDVHRARGHPRYPPSIQPCLSGTKQPENWGAKLKTQKQSIPFYFYLPSSKRWMTTKWIYEKKEERFPGQRWARNDFPAEFSHFKVLTALAKWAWVGAHRTGTGTFHRGWNDFLPVVVVFP